MTRSRRRKTSGLGVVPQQAQARASTLRGAKGVYCKRKGNIHVDVRARGRAKRSAPRKAAACAPGGTEGQ